MLRRLPACADALRLWEASGTLPVEGLAALLAHQVGALIVRGFYPDHERVAAAIEAQSREATNWPVSSLTGQLVESEVDTLGTPLNVAQGKGQMEQYLTDALANTRRFRNGCLMSPLDKLRLELDEAHSGGCIVARNESTHRLHAAGLIRIMRRGNRPGLVHIDDASVMRPDRGVFSCNIYLQNALAGGEVEIWPVTLRTENELLEHADAVALLTSSDAAAQAALRQLVLPTGPSLVIRPQPGDLIMLCVQRPHCVRGPIHGPRKRLSVQTFLAHEGASHPLKVEA